MHVPSQPIGQDPQSKMLWIIAKQLTELTKFLGSSVISGVCNGEYTATLSDTEDLPHFGWFEPTLLTGTVKYTTVNNEIVTRAYDLKETSKVRVRRIWSTGTTAAMGIKIYY